MFTIYVVCCVYNKKMFKLPAPAAKMTQLATFLDLPLLKSQAPCTDVYDQYIK